MSAEFAVWLFFPDGSCFAECRFVDTRTAVYTALNCSRRPAARKGMIRKIMITDADDFCVFMWQYGLGVTFPPRSSVTGHFVSEEDPNAVAIGEFAERRLEQHPGNGAGRSPKAPGDRRGSS